ncbi:MAG: hypothetical protein WCF17_01095 [Terracidiphilus sp.]
MPPTVPIARAAYRAAARSRPHSASRAIGLTYVLVNLVTDLAYRWINPRMRA